MKKISLWVAALLLLTGCAGVSPTDLKTIPIFDKIYYVVFKGQPEITQKNIYYGANLEIGKVLSEQPGANDLYVTKISISHKYKDMMKDNVVFYVSDGKLMYDTASDSGQPLSEGAKIMGFTGKTSLYMFKTKNKVKNASDALINKAKNLYDSATGQTN